MKKLLALLLVVLTVLPLLVACQGGEQPVETTPPDTDPGATEDPYDDKVPDLDFNEWKFLIASPTPTEWGPMNYDRTEETGETMNDAIYKRNRFLEARFNITIEVLPLGQTSMAAPYQPFKIANEDNIDLFTVCYLFDSVTMICNEDVLPWNGVEYINLEKPWWNSNTTDSLRILGNDYFIVGDINWSAMNQTLVCYFNKNVAEDYSEIVGDLYQKVRDGEWTSDVAFEISKKISNDVDGNSRWDVNDQYGALQNFSSGVTAYTHSFDYNTVIMTNDGPKMNFMTNKFNNIIQWMYKMCWEDHASYSTRFDGAQGSVTIPIFFDDRALFMFDMLYYAEGFRGYDSDFGIIPYPKWDTAQKDYATHQSTWGLSCGIPFTATNLSRTGAIVEAMCALSYKDLRPAYYELTLMGKLKRDDESEEMLDNYIFNNIVYDFGYCFATNLFEFCVGEAMIRMRNKNLTSWYRKTETLMVDNYNKVYDYLYEKQYGVKPGEQA